MSQRSLIFLITILLLPTIFIWYKALTKEGEFVLGIKTNSVDNPVSIVISTHPEFTITPSLVPTNTPHVIPTLVPTPTIIPTKIPTDTPEPPRYSSEEIYMYMDQLSLENGLNPHVIRHIAVCESGFRQDAVNGPNSGLFQFTSSTWQTYRNQMRENSDPDLRLDAMESIKTAIYMISIGGTGHWPNCIP